MKTGRKVLIILVVMLAFSSIRGEIHGKSEIRGANPYDGINKKWKLGYVESESFNNYAGTFYGIVKGLEAKGLLTNVEDIPYKVGQADSKKMWNWLANRNTGPYIQFLKDAHYNLSERNGKEEELLNRLSQKKDIDLLFAMGTQAGQLVADNRNSVPTMVFSSTNAVLSGIIKSVDDSGRDNLWARMDPERYVHQVKVFHDMFGFKKLGMVFENSTKGRVNSAVDDVQKVTKERNVELITEYVTEPKNNSQGEYNRYLNEVLAANKKLAKEVDAMYLSLGLWDLKDLPKLLQPFYENHVPVFSQLGSEEVMHGALVSVARVDFTGIGLFAADNIEQILLGTKPSDLNQLYVDTPSIVLNLEVAKKIGYKPPFDILLVADTVYQRIEK